MGDLLSLGVGWSNESVTLTYDGGTLATSNGIHYPVGVVVVDEVEESPSASRHSLDQSLSKVVVRYCDSHILIPRVCIACTKKQNMVMIRKWQFETVMSVDPETASINPSCARDMEQ